MSSITQEEAQAAAELVNKYNEEMAAKQEEYLTPIRHIVASREYQLVMAALAESVAQYGQDAGLIPHINGLVQIGINLMNVLGIQSADFSQQPAEQVIEEEATAETAENEETAAE